MIVESLIWAIHRPPRVAQVLILRPGKAQGFQPTHIPPGRRHRASFPEANANMLVWMLKRFRGVILGMRPMHVGTV